MAKFEQKFILLSFIKENVFISKLEKNESNDIERNCIINYEQEEKPVNDEGVNQLKKENEKLIDNYNKINNEKEIEKYSDEALERILTNLNNNIDKIIIDRIEQNNEKLEPIKQEYETKFEMIKQDILTQKKENEKLEKRLDEILIRIGELDGSNKENIINNESNIINDINNLKNINEYFKTKNNFQKNEINNFFPFMRQFNTMKMMYPFNFLGNENVFKNQMSMNDPRITQLLSNGFMNKGNYFHKK